ncbi:nucleotidyltransferase domain-containing protein [uncultured Clostridium sp.]|uniref:nucleotidyltransferase domain-containing protein n=1 Tax=uncultured Clostridium sp. TaxID=59620 RepID=UPI00260B7836|nr:nucleotidyltransferase domain-containing protein [uncultured Clostridium sp.]
MSFGRNIIGEKSKEEILKIIYSDEFKSIFLNNNINNVIVFGSLSKNGFNEESDIDIAVIGDEKIKSSVDLKISLELEELLNRSIDFIDINDDEIDNIIKIEALNSDLVILKDKNYDIAFNKYDQIYKENNEFWSRLDRVVLYDE